MFYAMQYEKAIELMQKNDGVDAVRLQKIMELDECGTYNTVYAIQDGELVPIVSGETYETTVMILNHPRLYDQAFAFVALETVRILSTTELSNPQKTVSRIYMRDDVPTIVTIRGDYIVAVRNDSDEVFDEIRRSSRCLSNTWEAALEEATTDVQSYPIDPLTIVKSDGGTDQYQEYQVSVSTVVFFTGGPNILRDVFVQSQRSAEDVRFDFEELIQWSMWELAIEHDAFRANVTQTDSEYSVKFVA